MVLDGRKKGIQGKKRKERPVRLIDIWGEMEGRKNGEIKDRVV